MNVLTKTLAAILIGSTVTVGITGCPSPNEGDTALHNLRTDGANFEINRRIVFYNGITNDYILSIEGLCTADTGNDRNVHVVCKTGPSKYKYHSLVRGDNMGMFVEQIEDAQVSAYHYKVVFRPQTIVPEIDIKTGK